MYQKEIDENKIAFYTNGLISTVVDEVDEVNTPNEIYIKVILDFDRKVYSVEPLKKGAF